MINPNQNISAFICDNCKNPSDEENYVKITTSGVIKWVCEDCLESIKKYFEDVIET